MFSAKQLAAVLQRRLPRTNCNAASKFDRFVLQVLTEPRLQVMPRLSAGGVSVPGRAAMVDTAPASALQIAVWKVRTVKMLRHGRGPGGAFLSACGAMRRSCIFLWNH